jgi:hypothetical protein
MFRIVYFPTPQSIHPLHPKEFFYVDPAEEERV